MTVTRRDIEEAAARIAGKVRETPVMNVRLDGMDLVLKLELLQHTGSFKPRGAFNNVLARPGPPRAGLIAASGGNHGLAVAYVARRLDVPAEIFVAEVTPAVKRERIAALGATVVVAGRLYQDALEASRRRASVTGAVEIHAYDHPATVAGQGTMAREIERQVPDVRTVVMAVGGGGFIGGAAAWFGGAVNLVAVEPRGSAALHHALAAGHPVNVEIDSVAGDSLGARSIGPVPFESIRHGVTRSVLVDDADIISAQRLAWSELRLVVEPGGATALAGVLSGAVPVAPGDRPVVVVCGANADPRSILD